MIDVVFVGNGCGPCEVLKREIARHRISVPIRNIDQDPVARSQFAQTGSRGVPTAVVGNRVLVGAQPILAALRARLPR
jgi:glutaredoxin